MTNDDDNFDAETCEFVDADPLHAGTDTCPKCLAPSLVPSRAPVIFKMQGGHELERDVPCHYCARCGIPFFNPDYLNAFGAKLRRGIASS